MKKKKRGGGGKFGVKMGRTVRITTNPTTMQYDTVRHSKVRIFLPQT